MADADSNSEGDSKPKGGGGFLMTLIIGLCSIVSGVSAPYVVAELTKPAAPTEAEVMDEPDLEEEVDFIQFDEVTVNLDEARFARFLRIKFSLQVAKSQKAEIEEMVKAKSVVFKNWIQIQLSEKSTEDLKGRYGRNGIRRELLDFFNKVLFEDGVERIQDILFDEFQVQ